MAEWPPETARTHSGKTVTWNLAKVAALAAPLNELVPAGLLAHVEFPLRDAICRRGRLDLAHLREDPEEAPHVERLRAVALDPSLAWRRGLRQRETDAGRTAYRVTGHRSFTLDARPAPGLPCQAMRPACRVHAPAAPPCSRGERRVTVQLPRSGAPMRNDGSDENATDADARGDSTRGWGAPMMPAGCILGPIRAMRCAKRTTRSVRRTQGCPMLLSCSARLVWQYYMRA
jgi:hypothetical protein